MVANKSAGKAPASGEPPPKRELTSRERAQLRAMTMCDERTIKRWWTGERVHPAIAESLRVAAKKLGIQT